MKSHKSIDDPEVRVYHGVVNRQQTSRVNGLPREGAWEHSLIFSLKGGFYIMFLAELRPQEKRAFLELAYMVASADGYLTAKEEALLEDYKSEMIMDADYQIEHWPIEQIVEKFESERSKYIALTELLGLIFSDGIYHEAERKSVEIIKQHFGFDPGRFESYRDWVEKIRELASEETPRSSDIRLTGKNDTRREKNEDYR